MIVCIIRTISKSGSTMFPVKLVSAVSYGVSNSQKFAYYCISYAYNEVSSHYSFSSAHPCGTP